MWSISLRPQCSCHGQYNNPPPCPWRTFWKEYPGAYWKEQPIWVIAIYPEFSFKLINDVSSFDYVQEERIYIRSYIKVNFIELEMWERNEDTDEVRKIEGWPREVINL